MAPKKSARTLKDLSTLTRHGYIDVPFALISDTEDHNRQYHAIIEPYWNRLVDSLKAGKYDSIVKMLERLEEKRTRAEERREKEQKELNRYQMLFNLVLREARHYGEEKTLLESLGTEDPNRSHPEWWIWRHGRTNSVDENDQPIDIKHHYYPDPNETFKSSFAADKVPEYPIPFNGEHTWKKVFDQVGRPGKTQSDQVERIKGLLAAIKFRISLIESVLWEYEILGDIEYYSWKESKKPPEVELPDDDLILFIKTGLEQFDKDLQAYQNRASLFSDVFDMLEWGDAEQKTLQDRLENVGLYNKKRGKPGRPVKLNEHPLLVEMIGLWRDFLNKGEKGLKG